MTTKLDSSLMALLEQYLPGALSGGAFTGANDGYAYQPQFGGGSSFVA
jgi:hypothetical protein